ncbi:MAG TPA: DNA polymerase III subunit gamma/tau [Bacteroidota bacterium]|nr:DNA polymerase III subunit gamma/tau [Bacteroidota bacterium]
MSYQVTARKWRPMVFDDVIGQTHVSNTLRNALSSGRLAHAFIFSGTRGCGKTTTARILARAVNCLTPKNYEPCNECEICREIIDGRSMDVIEIDGASNRGVEEIRNLRESVRYAPSRGSKKVYIIDEVHMLTKEAFNALLKTLEEPPSHVLFIFATTEIHKVPATILSRCQRYDFRRISVDEIMGRLRYIASQEGIAIDEESLLMIAKKGDGSMRDAQSIFDQVVSFCGTAITGAQVAEALSIVDAELYFRVTDAITARDTKAGLALVDDVVQTGYDLKEFLAGLTEHLRNLLIVKTTGDARLIEETELARTRYTHAAERFSVHDVLRLMKTVSELEAEIRYSVQPRFKVEIAIVQMTKMEESVKIDELLDQIEELKKKFATGNLALSASALTTHVPVTPVAAPRAVTQSSASADAGAFEIPVASTAGSHDQYKTAPFSATVKKSGPGVSEIKPRYSISMPMPGTSGQSSTSPLRTAEPGVPMRPTTTASGSRASTDAETDAQHVNAASDDGAMQPDVTQAPVRSSARTQAELDHPIIKILYRDFEADPL